MDKKRNISRWSIFFAVLIILIVAVVLGNGFSRTTTITLPSSAIDATQSQDSAQSDVIVPITVTPDTVQAVIASLVRSESYRHTVRIEQIWSGGSGLREVTVTQFGGYQRLDETLSDGTVQHTIVSDDEIFIWYDEDPTLYRGVLGDFTADQTQGIPTYEAVLDLKVSDILTATYDQLSGVRCIQVETAADDQGYRERFWVSVDTGLLVAAERLEADVSVYRMAVVSQEAVPTPNTYFILPNGNVLT